MMATTLRSEAYGHRRSLSAVDRLGVWRSARAARRHARCDGKRMGDFGCGFDARLALSLIATVASMRLVDVRLADYLKELAKVDATEGDLATVLPTIGDSSLDVVLCLSVLEHLAEPQLALDELVA
jgi:2-polyprenyl-3-methyl-5-hydroxy-6-metoxy-1,4-benzoquinol methylase